MDPRDEIDSAQLETLASAFGEQLLACLDECARGRKGLFSDVALLSDEEERVWPEAARLRQRKFALLRQFLKLVDDDGWCGSRSISDSLAGIVFLVGTSFRHEWVYPHL